MNAHSVEASSSIGDSGRPGSSSRFGDEGASLLVVTAASWVCTLTEAEIEDVEDEDEEEEQEEKERAWRKSHPVGADVVTRVGVAGGVWATIAVPVPGGGVFGTCVLPSAKSHSAARYSGRGSSGIVS